MMNSGDASKLVALNNSNNNNNNKTISANIGNANQISFDNFKLSNAQNVRDFLTNSVYNREKQSLRNKRYSQLIDTEHFDYNRNHPLIDNLIIHVENNTKGAYSSHFKFILYI